MSHSPARRSRRGPETNDAPDRTGTGGGKPLDYGRVIKLFVNKHTEALVDRQLSAVRRVARKNQDGCAGGGCLVALSRSKVQVRSRDAAHMVSPGT